MVTDIIQNILCASSVDDLMVSLLETRDIFEFEFVAFGTRVHLPVTSPKLDIISNYPPEWQLCYQQNRYDAVDPIVSSALSSSTPIIWSSDLYPTKGSFWEEAQSHGVSYGCSQSIDSGGASGILSFSRSSEQISYSEMLTIQSHLVAITHYAHTKFCQFVAPSRFPEMFARLTTREKDVLRWCADGKTSHEISIILRISERTVNFHLNNIFEKLNVTNKTAACVKAVNYRLI